MNQSLLRMMMPADSARIEKRFRERAKLERTMRCDHHPKYDEDSECGCSRCTACGRQTTICDMDHDA